MPRKSYCASCAVTASTEGLIEAAWAGTQKLNRLIAGADFDARPSRLRLCVQLRQPGPA